ncbi:MAG: cryptochrome/photolyase family protein [Gammaproteobacteria bacterium]|nr:cryptochrome/photolyase family protein [Gammaproteobacteria bacterium]
MLELVLVLGDQLSPELSALRNADPGRTRILMAEVQGEVRYAPHHAKKLAFIFAAMRHHAEALRSKGFAVDYVTLDDPDNSGTLSGELERASIRLGRPPVRITEPGEWRVRAEIDTWASARTVELTWLEDDRFLCSTAEFQRWAKGRKGLRMEHFYRVMRRRHDLLMEAGEPAGGRWNFDPDNREPLPPPLARAPIAQPMQFRPDAQTEAVLDLVRRTCPDAFGDLEPFWFAVTPTAARRAFAHFLRKGLPLFGDHQDAMASGEDFLYHAVISIYLNAGLLDPLACCRAAEDAWRNGSAPLNAVEGFIRQILGWREFIRGIYWLAMPGYAEENALDADLPLPAFYWSGDTGMRCLAQTVAGIRRNAYAHHIQRLMVTGNFALLAGLEPKAVCDWYLGVFADAYEWVELPNTLGMALHGDGGLFASKPYAASGRYIDRMSDYCQGCRYDPSDATGEQACPFNYLYWDFIARHRQRFEKHPRMAMIYRNLTRQKPERVQRMRELAAIARADPDAL